MSVATSSAASLVSRLRPMELKHIETALSTYVGICGPGRCSTHLLELLAAIHGHSRPDADNRVEPPNDRAHSGLITYSEAAAQLGVSRRTVGRRVAAGDLVTVGRRITKTSLEALQRRT